MRRRCYLIVRYRPEFDLDPSLADALPAWLPGSRARRNGHRDGLRQVRERGLREHRRVVRRALNRVRGFQAHLARDGVHGRVLNGGELLRYLVSRCNPTSATWGRLEGRAGWDGVLSRFDSPVERDEAREAARRLRAQVAASPLDFRRDLHHGEVEQDLVRTGYLGGSPSSTRMFWLRELLQQPLPFTLTVFLHGLARSQVQDEITRAWHQAQRENERRAGRGPPRRGGRAPGARAGAARGGDGKRPAGRAGGAVALPAVARAGPAAERERARGGRPPGGADGPPRDRRRGADAGHPGAGRAVALDAAAGPRCGAQGAALRDGARGRHDGADRGELRQPAGSAAAGLPDRRDRVPEPVRPRAPQPLDRGGRDERDGQDELRQPAGGAPGGARRGGLRVRPVGPLRAAGRADPRGAQAGDRLRGQRSFDQPLGHPGPVESAEAEGALPDRPAPGDAGAGADAHAGGAAGALHPRHLSALRGPRAWCRASASWSSSCAPTPSTSATAAAATTSRSARSTAWSASCRSSSATASTPTCGTARRTSPTTRRC